MKIVAWVVALAVASTAACACKGSGPATAGTGTGTGPGTAIGDGDPAACDGLAPHVEQLYRAAAARDAQAELTEGEVADNVAMVLGDCKAAPARVAPCVRAAPSVAQLEASCLIPLDDEGREGQNVR